MACAQDASRVANGEQPEIRKVRFGFTLLPYWDSAAAFLPYDRTTTAARAAGRLPARRRRHRRRLLTGRLRWLPPLRRSGPNAERVDEQRTVIVGFPFVWHVNAFPPGPYVTGDARVIGEVPA